LKKLVDLVGIEPTTSSMLWKKHSGRRLILKQLAAGRLVKNRYIGQYFQPISGQIFNVQNSRAAWAGASRSAHDNPFWNIKEHSKQLGAHDWEPDSAHKFHPMP
jgi:hypothetical protein